jgi:predicted aspartyl protease
MITGVIESGIHPRVMVELLTTQAPVEIDALVDSGFDGQLALHYAAADRYQLEPIKLAEVTYANGQKAKELVCLGKILWHNQVRRVQIVLSDDEEPAVGTRLMSGSIVTMNFVDNFLNIALPNEIPAAS